MKKRTLILVTAILTMSMLFCACGAESGNSAPAGPTDSSSAAEETVIDPSQMTPVEITITPENFDEYFTLSTEFVPYYNDFNEVDYYNYKTRLSLKEEYLERFVWDGSSSVAVEFNYTESNQTYIITDVETGAYEFTGEEVFMDYSNTTTLSWEHPNLPHSVSLAPPAHVDYLYYAKMNINEITRIEGKLYLYEVTVPTEN